jgi:hypothetical protein
MYNLQNPVDRVRIFGTRVLGTRQHGGTKISGTYCMHASRDAGFRDSRVLFCFAHSAIPEFHVP